MQQMMRPCMLRGAQASASRRPCTGKSALTQGSGSGRSTFQLPACLNAQRRLHSSNLACAATSPRSPVGERVPSEEQLGDGCPATNQIKSAAKAAASNNAIWDLNWFHYTPWWYKPHYLLIAGFSFIIGCNLGTTPCLKTTVIATAPVSVAWFIFLWMIPRQFSDFAKSYIKSHPECEEVARQQQAEQQAEAKRAATE